MLMLYVRHWQRYFVTFQHKSGPHWSLLYLYKKALQKQLQFRSLSTIDGSGGASETIVGGGGGSGGGGGY